MMSGATRSTPGGGHVERLVGANVVAMRAG